MKKLILNHSQLFSNPANKGNKEKYEFFDKLQLDNLKELYKEENTNINANNNYYFKISKPRFEEDLAKYGFKVIYNDWTNQEECFEKADGELKIAIPIKMNKDGYAYITSNMTKNKQSTKLIETIRRLINEKLVKTELVLEEKKN